MIQRPRFWIPNRPSNTLKIASMIQPMIEAICPIIGMLLFVAKNISKTDSS
jgi:hypothetical protein